MRGRRLGGLHFLQRAPVVDRHDLDESGQVIIPVVQNVTRITSYNVCYTKLLRNLAIFSLSLLALIVMVLLQSDWLRITSYNVCYTKLLRQAGPGRTSVHI